MGERADAIASGRLLIADPDLPERFRRGARINRYNRSPSRAVVRTGRRLSVSDRGTGFSIARNGPRYVDHNDRQNADMV